MRNSRRGPPTIRDVARLARVSASTVSRVLTGTTRVSGEKQGRVQRVIRQLHYRPNALARGLKLGRTQTLGLLIPDVTNPFFAEIAKGVEDAAHQMGFALVLCNAENDATREGRYLGVLRERKVDGLICITAGNGEQLQRLWRGCPLVVMDREAVRLRADVVVTNNERGAFDATRLLVDRGHRRIALLAGPGHLSPAQQRLDGYARALRESRIAADPRIIVETDFTVEGGRRATAGLLDRGLRPTAILASSDVMALGAMQAIHERGLRIPEDISVIGFDDIPLAAVVRPALTTVAQPRRQMGEVAVQLLVEQLRGPRPFKRIVLETTVVERASVAPPAGGPR